MAKTQKIKQAKWLKGVNSAAQAFAQPPGSFPRGSNLLYVKRGSLATCDGTSLISALNGVIQVASADIGAILELFLYEPIGGPNTYFSLSQDLNTHLAAPAGVAVAAGIAGALNGVYFWVVTALDGAGGETTISNEATQTLTNQKGNVTWGAVTNAVGYNIYRTVAGGASGTEKFAGTSLTASFTDNVADGSLGSASPPQANTTQVTQFYKIPATSYGAANIIKTFPASVIFASGGTAGGFGGAVSGTSSSNTPNGGVVGNLSPIPQILQFKNLMVLILGNGFAPYSSDGTNGNTIALANNFQASYASRTPSTAQNVGDQISVNISGTNYIFTVVQAGVTASGGAPSFNAEEGSIVADGTVYWKNSGKVAAVTAPRGAAHGIVYAGSLWVGNTYPTATSDNFDGPSCLKMSDLNNPNSWNPLNVAFLDRDDGTQITGLATFTIAESGIPPVGSLVAFKDFSTFQINGVFGASNFSIQRAQTDMGCVAGRTIQFVPGFGIVRLTHLGFSMFDGVRDRLLSEEIRPYLFGGQSDIQSIDWNYVYFSKAAQTAQPPMYVCACPLNVKVIQDLPAASGNAYGPVGTGLTVGTYYFVLSVKRTDGLHVTPEFSVTVTGPNQGIVVNLPPQTPLDLEYGIFFSSKGPGFSGQEDRFESYGGTYFPVGFFGIGSYSFSVARTIGSSQGKLTRFFCYDLVLKAWAIIDFPFPISVLHQFRSIGSIPITAAGGFNDGAVRRWLAGAGLDVTWDAGSPSSAVAWSVRTPEVFGKDASDRVYFRQIEIRGVGNPAGITASITVNGVIGSTLLTKNMNVLPMGGGEFVAYADIGITGFNAYAVISGSGTIEIQSVDWSCVPKAVRGRVAV